MAISIQILSNCTILPWKMHVLNLKHNKSHSNFVWFKQTRFIIRILKYQAPTLCSKQFVFKENCSTAPPSFFHRLQRVVGSTTAMHFRDFGSFVQQLNPAELGQSDMVGHVARRTTRGQNHRPPKNTNLKH